jgi:transcriptional regulator with XRE-family HTH domain
MALSPEHVAAVRIQQARKRHGWTQAELTDRLKALGVRIDRAAVAKIETNKRRLTLDELYSFSLALDVAPVHLLVPINVDADYLISVTPNTDAPADEVREWVKGAKPMVGQDTRIFFTEVPREEFEERRSAKLRELEMELEKLRSAAERKLEELEASRDEVSS